MISSGQRATCTSVRPYATVRSTIASKGATKRQLQGVQRLVAKLQAEAQHHTTCSERGAGYVREETVEVWMERLPTLVQGYAPENIWNEDETVCF